MTNEFYKVPNWLYEAFPYGYFIAGILVLINFTNLWGIVSGLLLISAGVLVVAMRLNYRKTKKAEGTNASAFQIGTDDGGVLKLVWEKKYESGNPGIDEQHQKLFKLGNLLLNAILSGWPRANIVELMDKLIHETEHHFRSEEKLLESWDYLEVDKHKQIHQALLDDARALRDEVEEGTMTYASVLHFFVNDLIIQHIIQEDKRYFFLV